MSFNFALGEVSITPFKSILICTSFMLLKNANFIDLVIYRSGTGKTTCLVFRMWSRFMAYHKSGVRPKMLFLTKSEMLKSEVERSFQNMGLAWFRRSKELESFHDKERSELSIIDGEGSPLFLTAGEWLDLLDNDLPGKRFFTRKEAAHRAAFRRQEHSVRRAIDALLEQNKEEIDEDEVIREEMTYSKFRQKFHKINSKVKSKMDPALAWLEVKSYIKGSLQALQLDNEERDDPANRFLSEAQYLALPKKQSRLDESQRKEVYPIYQAYENLKRKDNLYDEMDFVYNLVGRAARMRADALSEFTKSPLFEIDCIFVDEVQDFTVAELFLLTKLARDPNNCK